MVDLTELGLAGISVVGQRGDDRAMTTHGAVADGCRAEGARSRRWRSSPSHIGDDAVRHRGTIGGSLANNDPAADYPAAALALGATIKTDQRSIKADDFFQGMFTTALEQGELITAVEFPAPEKAAYEKFRNPASRYAIVGVYRREDGGRRARRGDRRGAERRVPPYRDGAGAECQLLAGRDRRRDDAGGRTEQRHPRQRRISRAPGGRDGEARGRAGALSR